MTDTAAVLTDVTDRIGTVTINRPEHRNALNSEVRRSLPDAVRRLDADDDVDVLILTGADPAFCAGLDLKELGSTGANVGTGNEPRAPWGQLKKPLIGAINGVAVTGGFELALLCDFLVASDRAAFADTHARVGVMPGWGLTVMLPQAIGIRRAREMSLTGNFMGAEEALAVGLVNRVVAHEELPAVTRSIARDIVGNEQPGVQRVLETYAATAETDLATAWETESRMGAEWLSGGIDPVEVERRRLAIVDRGRSQTSG